MASGRQIYFCPIHPEVRKLGPGVCPKCDESLLAEGARFGAVRRAVQNPLMFIHMAGLVALAMAVMTLIMTGR